MKWQQRVCLCLSLPVVSTLQDSVLKLKDVSNYKHCRGSLGAGRLRDFSRAKERRQRVLAVRHVPHLLPGMKRLWLCATDLDRAGGTASNLACPWPRTRLTLRLHGLGNQTGGQSNKKVVWLLEEAALIQNPGHRGSSSSSGTLQRWQQLLGAPFSVGSYQLLPTSGAGMPYLGTTTKHH